jgi:hypothetical protein
MRMGVVEMIVEDVEGVEGVREVRRHGVKAVKMRVEIVSMGVVFVDVWIEQARICGYGLAAVVVAREGRN